MKVSRIILCVASRASSWQMSSIRSLPPSPDESMPCRSVSYCVTGPHFHMTRVCRRRMCFTIGWSPSTAASASGVQWP